MRDAHNNWKENYDPYNLVPEDELVKLLWPPDGEQPITSTVEIDFENRMLRLSCETEGASIGYKTGREDPDQWNIYTGPLKLPEPGIIYITSHRIGYKPAEPISMQYN